MKKIILFCFSFIFFGTSLVASPDCDKLKTIQKCRAVRSCEWSMKRKVCETKKVKRPPQGNSEPSPQGLTPYNPYEFPIDD